MEHKEAAEIIASMANSLRDHPNQFHLSVNITGTSVSVGGPGPATGVHVQVSGGGPGSHTTGWVSRMDADGASFRIAQGRADEAFRRQVEEWVRELKEISDNLREDPPKEGVAKKILDTLKTSAPAVIVTAVTKILETCGVLPKTGR